MKLSDSSIIYRYRNSVNVISIADKVCDLVCDKWVEVG